MNFSFGSQYENPAINCKNDGVVKCETSENKKGVIGSTSVKDTRGPRTCYGYVKDKSPRNVINVKNHTNKCKGIDGQTA